MTRIKQKLLIGKAESRLPGLQYDGDNKVYCGICGRGFVWLGNHIIQGHHLSVDEYKDRFNLNRTQPLCTPEYSSKQRAAFIKRGMAGKHATIFIRNRGGKPYRRQGNLTLQDSPAVAKRQKLNSLKSLIKNTLYTCALCGVAFYGRPCEVANTKHYCSKLKCKSAADTLHSRKYRESHPDAVKASLAKYREAHHEEIKQKDRERWKAKYPIRRILTQPCLNCGEITTGRTSCGKLFCPDCRRIGAPGHLYYLQHKVTKQRPEIPGTKQYPDTVEVKI